MSDLKWYVVKAVSGQEKKVKSYLDNEILRRGLSELIPQVLIPSEKVYEMRNGKKYQRERNFFPGYVLINADLSHGEVIPIIVNIPGVLGFLSSDSSNNKKPVPLRQAEVNRILGKVDDANETGATLTATFILGESVKIIDGAFNGFTGVIEEIFDEKKKLNVMVKIFGRNTPMELNYSQVEKIE
ncbi:MAG: transcription termination/antitermination protein NusG [Microscillaceae bacterium]|jgi:transcriptional antiterminator NusG|nr:transcription termination/antitermination protein NusG [Microscillaceae bacterium]